MRVVPSARLLWWVAAAAVAPAALLVGAPALWPAVAAVWAVVALVALGDALAAPGRAAACAVAMPAMVRLTHERVGTIDVELSKSAAAAMLVRVAPTLPPELMPAEPVLRAALPAGSATATLALVCTPSRRGEFSIRSATVECASPLGLWSVRRTQAVRCDVRSYPNLFAERQRVPALFLYRGRSGAHRQRQIGKGREFEKLRDYLPGDSYEDVHWKATAKRGRPVTKLFQVERTQEVYAIVDSSRLTARVSESSRQPARVSETSRQPARAAETQPEPALERLVRAALVLALAAERQGDLFGLVTFADRVRGFVRARSGATHFQACREALYDLAPQPVSPDFDELATFLRLRLRRRALLVFLTDLDDPLIAESFQRAADLLRRQHLLLVCTLRPRDVAPLFTRPVEQADDLYRELAGHLRWHDQRELGRALERRGVGYASLEAESLSADVVSRYAAIKQRQAL